MQVSKYDRQIRLWGTTGQHRLLTAKVALVGCSPAGIQTLKNLFLSGVGQVDIWDSDTITIRDLSSSFFYSHSSVGTYKATEAISNLLQMNPDVKGHAYTQLPILQHQYTLLILTKSPSPLLCSDAIIHLSTIGSCFHITLHKPLHFVQFQKNFYQKYHLNLHQPFPSLLQYSHQWNIPQIISNIQHSQQQSSILRQIPFPIILLQACKPTLTETKQVLSHWQSVQYCLNIAQAASKAFMLYTTQHPPLQIIEAVHADSPKPLIFLKACNIYYDIHHQLPQPSLLPDMDTTTNHYLSLKRIYKQRHLQTVTLLMEYVQTITQHITLDQLSAFVDNIDAVKQIKIGQCSKQNNTQHYQQSIPNKAKHLLSSIDNYQKHVKGECLSKQDIQDKYFLQFCRVNGESTIGIHSMAGAVAAQEAIKLITGAFTPLKRGFLFNGYTNEAYQL